MQSDYREKTTAEKRKFWEGQISFWQSSGISQSEYCKRNDIRQSQWHYWRRRCRDTETGLTLVPLKIPRITGIGGKTPAVRVITPNGFTVELDAGVSLATLPQLIRELAAI